jgi:signal transduction histidine kinase
MDLGRLAEKRSLEGVSRELSLLRDRTRASADLVRNISHQLHPVILEDLGLVPALVEYCGEFQQRTGIRTSIECSNNFDDLSPACSSCLYYVVGECLRNVANHSHGTSATVTIESGENGLNLTIADDGMGFSADRGRSGIGITAMRERLHFLGGNLAIGPAQGKGVQVIASLPLP